MCFECKLPVNPHWPVVLLWDMRCTCHTFLKATQAGPLFAYSPLSSPLITHNSYVHVLLCSPNCQAMSTSIRHYKPGIWTWHLYADHGTYKQDPKMNLITQYGMCGVLLGSRVRVDFMLQNLAPPWHSLICAHCPLWPPHWTTIEHQHHRQNPFHTSHFHRCLREKSMNSPGICLFTNFELRQLF